MAKAGDKREKKVNKTKQGRIYVCVTVCFTEGYNGPVPAPGCCKIKGSKRTVQCGC